MPAGVSPFRVIVTTSAAIIGMFFLIDIVIPVGGPRRIVSVEARVVTEIKGMEAALSSFKAVYGRTPPSRIILHERPINYPYDLEGTDERARIEQRTVAHFRKMWPDFPILTCQFDTDGDGAFDRDWVDFNSNGTVDDVLDLDGAECLIFFLGGIAPQGTPIGFNNGSKNPFAVSDRRVGPFFELTDRSRLIDRDGDGFLELLDSLNKDSTPFLYFRADRETGYNFCIDRPTADNGAFQPYYSAGDPRVDRGAVKWYKPDSFQIISPGKDGKYGAGGFLPLPNDSRAPSQEDADNLTNFSSGRLRN